MKEKIEFTKLTTYMLIGLCVMIVLCAVVFFGNNWIKGKSDLEKFKSIQINSRIVELKSLNRGSHLIKIKYENSVLEFNLPISIEVNRNNIQVGDSLSKIANSGKCEIFKFDKHGNPTKITEFIVN